MVLRGFRFVPFGSSCLFGRKCANVVVFGWKRVFAVGSYRLFCLRWVRGAYRVPAGSYRFSGSARGFRVTAEIGCRLFGRSRGFRLTVVVCRARLRLIR